MYPSTPTVHRGRGRRLPGAIASAALLLSVAACGSGDSGEAGAEAIEIRYATANPETTAQMQLVTSWMEEVEERTGGQVRFEPYFGGSLLGALEIHGAVADGTVEMGYIANTYYPDLLPLFEIGSLPFVGDNEIAMMQTLNQMYQENELLQEEFANNGISMLAFHPVAPTALLTSQPVTNLEQMAGLRIRAIGYNAEAYQAAGAEPVAIDPNEMYEAVQRGVIDGVGALAFDQVPAFAIEEVAPNITNTGMGIYASVGLGINTAFFEGLPADVQETMVEAGEELMAEESQPMMEEASRAACETVLENGATVTEWEAQQTDQWRQDVVEALAADYVQKASEDGGHEPQEVQDFYDEFTSTYADLSESSDYETGMSLCAEQSS